MKKHIIWLLIFASSTVFACTECECKASLDIIIKNDTPSDCYIIQQATTDAILLPEKNAVFKITAGQTNTPLSFLGKKDKNITLVMQCGDEKFLTFTSVTLENKQSKEMAITGSVVSSSNMRATYTTTMANCSKSNIDPLKPSAIHWTLE